MTTEDAKREYANLAEEAIDRYGLAQTLEMIAEICYAKAEHIETNWQDKSTARVWEKAAGIISRTSTNSTIESLS